MMRRNPQRLSLLQLLVLRPPSSSASTITTSSRLYQRRRWWAVPNLQHPDDAQTSSSSTTSISTTTTTTTTFLFPQTHNHHHLIRYSSSSTTTPATFSSSASHDDDDDDEENDGWEDEDDDLDDDAESQIGDGGDGGGVVLRGVEWGERVLGIAHEVLDLHFSKDFRVFAFRTSPRGYIYVRLDKLSTKYGCPSMQEIENFSCLYKKQLDEIGEKGEVPIDLALEVSSAGAERILKVPNDLDRFKDMPMQVRYLELNPNCQQKEGVFMLESLESESEHCVWKLADVKENRDESSKGRPLSRKQKDWRLRLPFGSLKRVTLYLDLS